MSRDAFCIVEHRAGRLDPDSLQLFTAARKLEARAVAIVCSAEPDGVVEDVTPHADHVIAVEDAGLAEFTPDGYAQALVPLIEERGPAAVLTLHSHFLGRDLAPVLASRLGSGLMSDCIDVEWRDAVIARRLIYRRKLVATQRCTAPGTPVLTCQRGAFVAAETAAGTADVEKVTPALDPAAIRWAVRGFDEAEVVAGDITEAEIVVAAGRGVGSEENLDAVKELTKVLGGALGASRPIVDQGWLDRGLQVGSSGKTVRPRLYIGFGISGAIQHVVGMRDSDVIVAVNKDARAPIFEYADYGIVADVMDIVGPLTEAIRASRG